MEIFIISLFKDISYIIGDIIIFIIILLLIIFRKPLLSNITENLFDFISKFLYTPKKSREIYEVIWAHRGEHTNKLENTVKAYSNAVRSNMGIEMDIRITKDSQWVCFHDRYATRLLGFPGKASNKTYKELRKYSVLGSKEKVPLLKRALNIINGKVPILIEVKGNIKKQNLDNLYCLLESYEGRYYFHVKNILTYFKLRKKWKDKVFFILNPFRKRFKFVKGKHYRGINVPTGKDLIISVEEGDTVKKVVQKLWYSYNKYSSRIKKGSVWLTKVIVHRGIISKEYLEQSIEAIRECVKRNVIIEFDVVWYKGEIRCYHSDKISSKLGQKKSCSEKIELENSPTLKDVLKEVNGKTEIIIDIKDFNRTRILEEEMMKVLSELNYDLTKICIASFNPWVLQWFYKNHSEIYRILICNSISSLKKITSQELRMLPMNFALSYEVKPDAILYDIGKSMYFLSKFNKIIGLPIFAYAPKSYKELKPYLGFFDNAICENVLELQIWRGYLYMDKNRTLKKCV